MSNYATVTQLIERTNVLRLTQLCVPTDVAQPSTDLVRAALLGQDTSLADDETLTVLAKAVAVVQTALGDAADLMRSYHVPAPQATVPAALVRINCALAMHYLLEQAGAVSDTDTATYKANIHLLEQHQTGRLTLVPSDTVDEMQGDAAVMYSQPPRYGRAPLDADDEVAL